MRRKILHDQDVFTRRSFEEPEAVKQELLAGVRAYLGPDYDVEHALHAELPAVAPAHRLRARRRPVQGDPLGQGLGGHRRDRALHRDRHPAEVGQELEADIIITATGFNLSVLGDIDFTIDGKPLDFADTVTYRGMMFTGVPNMVWVFGYFRASWTLRADLVADFVCRLLNHMKAKRRAAGRRWRCGPKTRTCRLLPWIDPENFNPGYLMRGMHLLPKRGDKPEWQHTQDYWREKDELPAIDLDDEAFVYA